MPFVTLYHIPHEKSADLGIYSFILSYGEDISIKASVARYLSRRLREAHVIDSYFKWWPLNVHIASHNLLLECYFFYVDSLYNINYCTMLYFLGSSFYYTSITLGKLQLDHFHDSSGESLKTSKL